MENNILIEGKKKLRKNEKAPSLAYIEIEIIFGACFDLGDTLRFIAINDSFDYINK